MNVVSRPAPPRFNLIAAASELVRFGEVIGRASADLAGTDRSIDP